ncbi:DUF423 domain-containing protein [Pontiella sp.]|uniref:DUF423 domain-containing protein n=1 Tax=Pontiella sp. TaxID=2837462 RepID=UPI0035615612
MNSTAKLFLSLGAVSGAIGVILGAFGAHGLQDRLTEKLMKTWQTGVEYQFYHTFALLVIGLLALKFQSGLLTSSGWSFVAGILLFSGSLYALSLSGITKLGAITPIGGLFFIAGWILLTLSILKTG